MSLEELSARAGETTEAMREYHAVGLLGADEPSLLAENTGAR